MEYLSPQEFKEVLAHADPHVCIDVRTAEEYAQGHIEGVRNVPLTELAQRIAEFKDAKVVHLHCRSGARALASAQLLTLHYPSLRVVTIEGGYDAWINDIRE